MRAGKSYRCQESSWITWLCSTRKEFEEATRTAEFRNYLLETLGDREDPTNTALLLAKIIAHRAVFLSWKKYRRQQNSPVYTKEGKHHILFFQISTLD